jgi:hypothetical protein
MLPRHEVREAREWYARLSALRLLGFVTSGDGDFSRTPGMLRVASWLPSSMAEGMILISVQASGRIFQVIQRYASAR